MNELVVSPTQMTDSALIRVEVSGTETIIEPPKVKWLCWKMFDTLGTMELRIQ